MIAIIGNEITAIDSMSDESGTFPKENILNTNPKIVAKSVGNSTTITFGASGGIRDIALININSDEVVVSVTDNATSTIILSETRNLQRTYTYENLFLGNYHRKQFGLIDLGDIYESIEVSLQFNNNNSDPISIGGIVAGFMKSYGEDAISASDSPNDKNRYIETESLSKQKVNVGYTKDKNFTVWCDPEHYHLFYTDMINAGSNVVLATNSRGMEFEEDYIRYGYVKLKQATRSEATRMQYSFDIISKL